jgi:hypothetical protein
VNEELPQPDRDRLSILIALVLLAYSLIRIVSLPTAVLQYSWLGLIFRLEINTSTVMIALATLISVSGADWVIRTHPEVDSGQRSLEHWILPALAAMGIGIIVIRLPAGPFLAAGLLAAGVLFGVVILWEFISADQRDPRLPSARLGLRIVSYLLLTGTLFAIFATDARAIVAIPAVLMASVGVSWRVLRLQLKRRPLWHFGLLLGWLLAQLSWALHYWPIPPIQGALILTVGAYLGNELLEAHLRGGLARRRALEILSIGTIAFAAIVTLT